MVAVDRLDDSNYIISLSPNSSLVGIYRIIFLASITFVCGGIATIFYFFGAALILPFAGIELMILFIAFLKFPLRLARYIMAPGIPPALNFVLEGGGAPRTCIF